jgi:hypothetical protein
MLLTALLTVASVLHVSNKWWAVDRAVDRTCWCKDGQRVAVSLHDSQLAVQASLCKQVSEGLKVWVHRQEVCQCEEHITCTTPHAVEPAIAG